jgi:hypothetical protein
MFRSDAAVAAHLRAGETFGVLRADRGPHESARHRGADLLLDDDSLVAILHRGWHPRAATRS